MWHAMTQELSDLPWYETAEVWLNGERLEPALLLREYEVLRAGYAERMSEKEMEAQEERLRRDAVENAIERRLLLDEARRRISLPQAQLEAAVLQWRRARPVGAPEPTPEEEAEAQQQIQERLLLDRFFDSLYAEVPRPFSSEVRAWYDEHPDDFERGEQVHLVLIYLPRSAPLSSPRDRMLLLFNARERLAGGEPFETVNNGLDGWLRSVDMGWQQVDQLSPAFRAAVADLPVGGISEVFAMDQEFHIARVLDRRPPARLPLSEVWRAIETHLWNERKDERLGRELDRLRAAARIEILGLPPLSDG